eukprot:421571-Prymnesium_polylepis.1
MPRRCTAEGAHVARASVSARAPFFGLLVRTARRAGGAGVSASRERFARVPTLSEGTGGHGPTSNVPPAWLVHVYVRALPIGWRLRCV